MRRLRADFAETQDLRLSFGPKINRTVIVGYWDNRTALAQSPHYLRMAPVQRPHERHTISLRNLWRPHGNCTGIVRFAYDLRTISTQPPYGNARSVTIAQTRNRMMLVYNVKAVPTYDA